MIVDNNKEVQKSGCSALATMEEEAGNLLVPFIQPILQVFIIALGKYQVPLFDIRSATC
jgi:transportin-1